MTLELVTSDLDPSPNVLAVVLVKLLVDNVELLRIVESVVERNDVALKLSVPFAVLEAIVVILPPSSRLLPVCCFTLLSEDVCKMRGILFAKFQCK